MTPADEPDSPTTDPNPGTVSGERADQPPSVTRVVGDRERRRASSSPESDTLLSAPQVTREDLAFDERLSATERQLEELRLRLERLEQRPREAEPVPAFSRWFWLVFLAALALAWQILAHFR
jgi:hypothetical protein